MAVNQLVLPWNIYTMFIVFFVAFVVRRFFNCLIITMEEFCGSEIFNFSYDLHPDLT